MAIEAITVYLSLGSNMGDRQQNLDWAINHLSHRLRTGQISSIYETEPIDNTDQSRFLNMVCQIYTTLAPAALLVLAKGIENKLGRIPTKPNSPRPIDIDILLYGEQVIDTLGLTIPHPRMAKRAFVLVPLAEIAPAVVHPTSGKTIKKILKDITEIQGVSKWETG